jgi:hypothetical protein
MKKEYQRPRIVKVDLKVQQTVLADCKAGTEFGPFATGCQPVGPCSTTGTGS